MAHEKNYDNNFNNDKEPLKALQISRNLPAERF